MKIEKELDATHQSEYISAKKEEVRKKKEKLAISGGSAKERAKDFAKLNYLLDFRASDVEDGWCVLPSKDRKPVKRDLDKMRMLKMRAKAVKVKLMLS